MQGYMTAKQASIKWGISMRRVQKLCSEGRLPNITKYGNQWAIPNSTDKPPDARKNNLAKNQENEV